MENLKTLKFPSEINRPLVADVTIWRVFWVRVEEETISFPVRARGADFWGEKLTFNYFLNGRWFLSCVIFEMSFREFSRVFFCTRANVKQRICLAFFLLLFSPSSLSFWHGTLSQHQCTLNQNMRNMFRTRLFVWEIGKKLNAQHPIEANVPYPEQTPWFSVSSYKIIRSENLESNLWCPQFFQKTNKKCYL